MTAGQAPCAGAPGSAGGAATVLPELASVPWRARTDARWLSRWGRIWQAWTVLYTIPFLAAGAAMLLLEPLAAPVAAIALAHAWVIPELYASRGATVVRPKGPRNRSGAAGPVSRGATPSVVSERAAGSPAEVNPEAIAQGLLGDLLEHEERELQRRTGLALEAGDLGVWLVGEAGALLVTPGGRRVHCYCVRTTDPELPPSDRIAHLLLALREDEGGFATVANHAFAGAPWRVRRRLPQRMRPALDEARRRAR